MTLTPRNVVLLLMMTVPTATGCNNPRDVRLARLAEQHASQQAAVNKEMARLNRDVAATMQRMTSENAEFRAESLALQKQLHTQRVELVAKQDALNEERRQFHQHDPLVAQAVTHVGITLACLLPLALCWQILKQAPEEQLDPVAGQILFEDIASAKPVLTRPFEKLQAPRLGSLSSDDTTS